MTGPIVYSLCALTCCLCAGLLLRAYGRQGTRLLFWSGAAFCAFGISNIMLLVDLVFVPAIDLSLVRNAVTLVGVVLLLRGLIWESTAR